MIQIVHFDVGAGLGEVESDPGGRGARGEGGSGESDFEDGNDAESNEEGSKDTDLATKEVTEGTRTATEFGLGLGGGRIELGRGAATTDRKSVV